jgi:small subunit ribosomal protein S1
VELAEGVEGLCHFSEVPGYSGRRGGEPPPLTVGQAFDFKIVKMSEAEKKVGLSLRAAAADDEKSRLVDYQRQAQAATSTIEEVMSLKDKNPK